MIQFPQRQSYLASKEDLHKTIFCNAANRRVIMHHSVQMAALAEEAELCKGGISGRILVLWDDAFSSLTSQLAPNAQASADEPPITGHVPLPKRRPIPRP
jgi:hypothetical protein